MVLILLYLILYSTRWVAHGFSRGVDEFVKHAAPTSKEVGHRYPLWRVLVLACEKCDLPCNLPYERRVTSAVAGKTRRNIFHFQVPSSTARNWRSRRPGS